MKLSIQLSFLSAINIGLFFILQRYIFTQVGPGVETDALFAGMTIPQLVFVVISGSLTHVLVPLLTGSDRKKIRHDAWTFFVLIGGTFSVLATFLYFTASWWVPLTVPGFSEESKELTILLTRIHLVGMVFNAITGVQSAVYHANQQFLWVECSLAFSASISLAILIWLLPHYGVIAAAYVLTLRFGMHAILLIPIMGKPIYPNFKSSIIQEAWGRIKPLLLGTAYYKTDTLIDRFLLSMATSGSLSLYYLAQQIYSAFSQVLSKSIVLPLVSRLSQLYKLGGKTKFRHKYHQKRNFLGMVCIAVFVFLGGFGKLSLGFIIGYGGVTVNNVEELWWIMIWLGGMFIGGVLGQASSSAYYAIGDTKTPTRIGLYSYTLYVPIKITVFFYFGIKGLAISTSVFFLFNFFMQNYMFRIGDRVENK